MKQMYVLLVILLFLLMAGTASAYTTPPASITNLTNNSGTNYINWTWTDPTDSDFDHVEVYLDGIFQSNVTKGLQHWRKDGLTPSTSYTIGTHTVDALGNVNTTWVTDWKDLGVLGTNIFIVKKLDDGIVIAGDANGHIFRSTNNGFDWTDLGAISATIIRSAAYSGNGVVVIGDNLRHIFRSTNYGINWTDLGQISTVSVNDLIYLENETFIFVTSTPGHIFRSTNNGLNWTDLGQKSTAGFPSTAYLGNGIVIAEAANGHIFRSTDYGLDWTDIGLISGNAPMALNFGGGITVIGDVNGHLYRSTDYGLNWIDLGLYSSGFFDTFPAYLGNGVAVAGGQAGHIYKTTDYGATWSDLGLISTAISQTFTYSGNGVIIMGDSAGHIFRSTTPTPTATITPTPSATPIPTPTATPTPTPTPVPGLSISIVPPSTTANQSDTFSVNVNVNPTGLPVKGVEINLKFDPSVVQLNSVVMGGFLGSSPQQFQNNVDNTNGTLKLAHTVSPGNPAVTSSGTYAILNFKVNSIAPAGTSNLGLTKAVLSNDTGANIPGVTRNNGTITVSSPTSTPTPTPTATPTPTPTPVPGLSISIVPPSTTANQSDTFSVNVNVNPAGLPVEGVEIILKFDPSVVQLNSVVIGSFLGSSPQQFQNNVDNTNGMLKLAHIVNGGNPAVTSSGTYATLNFKVNSTATPGTSTLNLTMSSLANDTGANIPGVTSNNGTITVSSPTSTPTPTPTATPTPTPTATPTPTPTPVLGLSISIVPPSTTANQSEPENLIRPLFSLTSLSSGAS